MSSTRGPAPKRDEQRAGHRTKAEAADRVQAFSRVAVPPPDPKWSVSARRMYRSLAESGQARYFEPSDWEFARLTAELQTATETQPSANAWKIVFENWSALGATENARRRMRIEVDRKAEEPEDAAASAMLDRLRQA